MLTSMRTSGGVIAGVAQMPLVFKQTVYLTKPPDCEVKPLASSVPTVSQFEVWTGGLHEGALSAGPWNRFGVLHWLYAMTVGTLNCAPAAGRTWVAMAE